MSWFEKLLPSAIRTESSKKKGVPEGLWIKCLGCNSVLYHAELERNLQVCPKCGHHHPIQPRVRLASFVDEGVFHEFAEDVQTIDRLKFRDSKKYKDRLLSAQKNTDEREAIMVVRAQLHNIPVVIAVFNFAFMGGSMGSAVGEKFVRACNEAISLKTPLICFSTSGGARMQEGLISLMQMAKTSIALTKTAEHGLPFISVLTDPTMGGVSASLAMLGDVIIAEPRALIGFAGPRVIEQTVRQTLPEGFQRSEFLFEHGHIDMIVDRRELRIKIARILAKMLNLAVIHES